jgi:hypothetical protein
MMAWGKPISVAANGLDVHDKATNRNAEYWKMVAKWHTIVAQPVSDDDKRAMCLALLREFIDRMASSTARRPNPTLQLYANMVVLRQLVSPGLRISDALGSNVILPACRMVGDWIDANQLAR